MSDTLPRAEPVIHEESVDIARRAPFPVDERGSELSAPARRSRPRTEVTESVVFAQAGGADSDDVAVFLLLPRVLPPAVAGRVPMSWVKDSRAASRADAGASLAVAVAEASDDANASARNGTDAVAIGEVDQGGAVCRNAMCAAKASR
jgi:hypothetical protein